MKVQNFWEFFQENRRKKTPVLVKNFEPLPAKFVENQYTKIYFLAYGGLIDITSESGPETFLAEGIKFFTPF